MCSHSSSGSRRFFPRLGRSAPRRAQPDTAFDIGAKAWSSKRYKRPICSTGSCIRSSARTRPAAPTARPAPARDGFDTPGTGGMERIPQGRPDRRHLFVAPPVGAHPAPADHATLPGAGHAARARSLRPLPVRLHEQGICHEDFNQTNILWEYDGTAGNYRFS